METPAQIQAILHKSDPPLFIYDSKLVTERIKIVKQCLDEYYYPVKVCPERKILQLAVSAGVGIDLCSAGDLDLLESITLAEDKLSFTSVHTDPELIRRLYQKKAIFDADSVDQAMAWKAAGGRECGLRICVPDQYSPYGVKFGIPLSEIALSIQFLEKRGLLVRGLHLHESHADSSPREMAERLATVFHKIDQPLLTKMKYLNIGGGWPVTNGTPSPERDMVSAMKHLRTELKKYGFCGKLSGEPGEWVVGNAGYWVMRVSAIKAHPLTDTKTICIVDSATPIPCRPSKAEFVLLNASAEHKRTDFRLWDIYGSANNGSDTIGSNVPLGDVQPGDIIVSCCQGAYVHSLISSFNERPLPSVLVV